MSAGERAGPRLFTIPPSRPFLAVLADALLDGRLVPDFSPRGDALALAGATVFLPTRRAGRLFAEALRERMPGGATLLPRIVALGDVDEDALAFAEDHSEPPHAVAPATRRLALASLVGRWRALLATSDGRATVAAGPGAELALADALARLIDEMAVQEVPWSRLEDLVPGEHDLYWDMALDFLKIASRFWPEVLASLGAVDGAVRRDALVDAEARRLTEAGAGAGPVIAAGSTGSMPATARLLAAVARLPKGCVVLPGLDTGMDEVSWAALTAEAEPSPSHPQYGLALLLQRYMQVARAEVVELAPPVGFGREALLSEALRPVATTQAWASLDQRLPAPAIDAALAGVTVIEAEDPREEALTVALALRETLEQEGRTAALITPDRDLARRVAAEMLRFGVTIDDSAGEPLSETSPGRFARLVADVAVEQFAPVPLSALLRHELARFALPSAERAMAVDALDLMALRGPRPAPGPEGLIAAVDGFAEAGLHPGNPRRAVSEVGQRLAADLARRLAAAFAPLQTLARGRHLFSALLDAHRAALGALLTAPDEEPPAAGNENALTELAATLDRLAEAARQGEAAGAAMELSLADYASAFPLLLASSPVRPALEPGTRLRILGPLEARLVAVDRAVLAGLVEQTWPAAVTGDPWLSRPMRQALGLEAPERRIGLSAHDFVQYCGAAELILSRPQKLGGAPTVPSRFLQRLAAVTGEARWAEMVARGNRLRRLAGLIDEAPKMARLDAPAPCPPLRLRPRRLSITEIETWLRDPYSIYARHVLKLRPLDGLDEAPGAAERGSAIHEALGEFAKAYPRDLPADALAQLLACGRRAFADLEAFPAEHALWWARFERLAARVLAWEVGRRPFIAHVHAEIGGKLEIPTPRGGFALTGRADRIEERREGGLVIVDFKTGAVPTAKQTSANYSPQLPLEAAMAARGAFDRVPARPAAHLAYVRLGAASVKEVAALEKDDTASALAETTYERLCELIAAFENEAQPYVSLRRPMFAGRFGDYDHLARIKEWSTGGEAEE